MNCTARQWGIIATLTTQDQFIISLNNLVIIFSLSRYRHLNLTLSKNMHSRGH